MLGGNGDGFCGALLFGALSLPLRTTHFDRTHELRTTDTRSARTGPHVIDRVIQSSGDIADVAVPESGLALLGRNGQHGDLTVILGRNHFHSDRISPKLWSVNSENDIAAGGAQMAVAVGFGERVRYALERLNLRRPRPSDEITQEAFGSLVAAKLSRKPYKQGAVGNWLSGTIPNVVTIQAMAEILSVDPGWLAFGEASEAPAPGGFQAVALPTRTASTRAPRPPLIETEVLAPRGSEKPVRRRKGA